MQELAAGIQSLAGIIDKAGTIGLLIIYAVIVSWALLKFRAELAIAYARLNYVRALVVRYRGALDAAGIKVSLDDIDKLFDEKVRE